jgi:hypothetical protein
VIVLILTNRINPGVTFLTLTFLCDKNYLSVGAAKQNPFYPIVPVRNELKLLDCRGGILGGVESIELLMSADLVVITQS